jgi:NAD(P)-dependent dehydrogenase (short-subunit alcohol dehydrogenase family)
MGETLAFELAPLNIRVLIVEPGSFRTEGIYINPFDVSNPIPDYDEHRADSLITWNAIAGKQPGDPVKAMNAVVDVVRGEGAAAGRMWPSYLILGRDAEIDIRNKCAKMIRHLDEWSDVVRGVDIDEV